MKGKELIKLLQSNLPKYTDDFSTTIDVVSITSSGTTASVNALSHDLSVDEFFMMMDAPSDIAISTLDRSETTGTLTTATKHDITNGLETITITGATESEFNGTFDIINVDDRFTIRFSMIDSGATTATGSPVLVDGQNYLNAYNGLYQVVSVIDENNFTYTTNGSDLLPVSNADSSPKIQSKIRISGSATIERVLEAYTKQIDGEAWGFVVLGDVVASKSRHMLNDSVGSQNRASQGEDFRQQIIQQFSFYVFIPTSNALAARQARDKAEEYFSYVCGSVLFFKPDSGLSVGNQSAINFVNHGMQAYNDAFYVHQYSFETLVDLSFGDTIGYDDDVAFRDIQLLMTQSTGIEQFTASINLDDEES